MDSTRPSRDELRELRKISRMIRSTYLPGTDFFGVKTFAFLMNLTPEFVRERMKAADCKWTVAGNKELMFCVSDYARILGGIQEE